MDEVDYRGQKMDNYGHELRICCPQLSIFVHESSSSSMAVHFKGNNG